MCGIILSLIFVYFFLGGEMSGIKELEIGVFLDFHGSDLFFVARPLRDLHSTKISPKTLGINRHILR